MHAGLVPDKVLGASLGSFAAATVAGMIDAEDALTAVVDHAKTLEMSCEPGGMLAILHDPVLYDESFLTANCELAAVNFASHFVVSAPLGRIAEIESSLKSRGVTYQRLPVLFAFHSQWIENAKEPFRARMQAIPCHMSRLPMVCCDQATTLASLPENYFWEVTRHPIRFRDAIARLEQDGVCQYIDVGPAGTLATFLKYALPAASASTARSILTLYGCGLQNFAALTSDPR
jgi:acyl transferase domain-containing protein